MPTVVLLYVIWGTIKKGGHEHLGEAWHISFNDMSHKVWKGFLFLLTVAGTSKNN